MILTTVSPKCYLQVSDPCHWLPARHFFPSLSSAPQTPLEHDNALSSSPKHTISQLSLSFELLFIGHLPCTWHCIRMLTYNIHLNSQNFYKCRQCISESLNCFLRLGPIFLGIIPVSSEKKQLSCPCGC